MDETSYICPSCGEEIVVPVDPSQGTNQRYTEDCPVCCHPVELRIEQHGEQWAADAAPD